MYDYTQSGYDEFMSRSIDSAPQNNLDSQTPPSSSIRFDFSQLSGAMGDTLRLGNIRIDGTAGAIVMSDGSNDVLLIGNDNNA